MAFKGTADFGVGFIFQHKRNLDNKNNNKHKLEILGLGW